MYHNGPGGAEGLTEIGNYNIAPAIFVAGDDVYVAGECEYEKDKPIAMVWKNGKPLYYNDKQGKGGLTRGRYNSRATSIFVIGDDVFVTGIRHRIRKKGRYTIATVWKNGVPLYEHRNGRAAAIFVVPRN